MIGCGRPTDAPRHRVALLPRVLRRARLDPARRRHPVNAVRGLLDMIARLVTDFEPTHLVACWDDDWRPQWRVDLIPSYKAHRVAEARARRPRRRGGARRARGADSDDPPRCSSSLGIAVVGAADARGRRRHRHARHATPSIPVDVVTGDRDLFQLVDDAAYVRVIYTARGMSKLEVLTDAVVVGEVRRAAAAVRRLRDPARRRLRRAAGRRRHRREDRGEPAAAVRRPRRHHRGRGGCRRAAVSEHASRSLAARPPTTSTSRRPSSRSCATSSSRRVRRPAATRRRRVAGRLERLADRVEPRRLGAARARGTRQGHAMNQLLSIRT